MAVQDFTIREAALEDLPAALAVQHDAFGRVARRFGIPLDVLPPASETLEDLVHLRARGFRTWIAEDEGRVVGTVRGILREDGVVEIGRLAVGGDHLRRGIARALMLALESGYPDVTRFELFTGEEAAEPLALYRSLGYEVFSTEAHEHVTLVWLAKVRATHSG